MTTHSGNKLIDAEELCTKAQLQPGLFVAVFGTGRTGHMVFPAAVRVGETGVVYAVDIMKDTLEVVAKRAALEGFENIHTVWSDIEKVGKTAIPAGSLDVVFLVNILVLTTDREAVMTEAARLLKPKGRLVIVDWRHAGLPIAPPKERFPDWAAIKAWGGNNGFAIEQEFEAGRYHTGLILYRQR